MKKNTIRKIVSLCLMLSIIGTLAMGCNDENKAQAESETKTEEETKEIKRDERLDMIQPAAYSSVDDLKIEKGSSISIIGQNSGGAYWSAVKEGAEKAVEEINEMLGYENSDKIKLVYSAPSNSDVEQQINILDEETARYPVAVAISPIDMTACEVQFDLAAENNIPIITFNSGSDYQGVTAFVGTDNNNTSAQAAEAIEAKVDEGSRVLIVSSSSQCKAEQQREQTFKDIISKSEKKLQTIDTVKLDDDEASLEAALKSYPNIKGVYATSSKATDAVAKELTKTKYKYKGITAIGFDITETTTAAIKDGVLDAVMVQNPYGMGYATVVASARSALDMGNEAAVDTGYAWITKDNQEESSSLY